MERSLCEGSSVAVIRWSRECSITPGFALLPPCRDNNFASSISAAVTADVDVDVVDLRAQADASMPASNNNVNYTIYSNF